MGFYEVISKEESTPSLFKHLEKMMLEASLGHAVVGSHQRIQISNKFQRGLMLAKLSDVREMSES